MKLEFGDLEILRDKLMDLKVSAWRQRVLMAVDEEMEEARQDEMEAKRCINEDYKYRMNRYYAGEGER